MVPASNQHKVQYGSNQLEGTLAVKCFVPLKFTWNILYLVQVPLRKIVSPTHYGIGEEEVSGA